MRARAQQQQQSFTNHCRRHPLIAQPVGIAQRNSYFTLAAPRPPLTPHPPARAHSAPARAAAQRARARAPDAHLSRAHRTSSSRILAHSPNTYAHHRASRARAHRASPLTPPPNRQRRPPPPNARPAHGAQRRIARNIAALNAANASHPPARRPLAAIPTIARAPTPAPLPSQRQQIASPAPRASQPTQTIARPPVVA